MPADDTYAEQHTLGNDDIHVHYRNERDLIRQAVDFVGSRAGAPESPDGQISLPLKSFRLVAEALRTTYKTLGETLHQDLSMETPGPAAPAGQGGAPPAEAEAMVRFSAIEPRGREALRQLELYSGYNEDRYRRGDQIVIPARVFQDVSTALLESNQLMTEVLSEPRLLRELVGARRSAAEPNHGDYGAAWDPFNYGDWFTTASGQAGHD